MSATGEVVKLGQIGLISEHAHDVSFVSSVASYMGCSVLSPQKQTPQAIQSLLDSKGLEGIFLRLDNQAVIKELESSKSGIDPNRVYAFANEYSVEEADNLLSSPAIGNLIFLKSESPVQAGKYFGEIMLKSQFSDELVPFDKTSSNTFVKVLYQSKQKSETVKEITDRLTAMGVKQKMITAAATALDEMIMNAFFDAPIDEGGKQIHAHTDRATNIDLSGTGQSVGVSLCFREYIFAVTVVDRRGSLTRRSVFKHACKSFFNRRPETPDLSRMSSGLGLAMVTKLGGSLLFKSRHRQMTSVTAFFRTDNASSESKKRSQFIIVRLV